MVSAVSYALHILQLTSSSFHCQNMRDSGHSKSFKAKHWPRSSGVMNLGRQLLATHRQLFNSPRRRLTLGDGLAEHELLQRDAETLMQLLD